ncbi:hypothetical protein BC826DRAFT_1109708 [Russula brevipes]|nr:hypothetical protein BC826DRAFT_1109708 [Russula brevipes]
MIVNDSPLLIVHSHYHRLRRHKPPAAVLIINNALKAYEKRTKNDLLAYPAPGLRLSHQHSRHATTASSGAQSVSNPPPPLTGWLDPIVNVLYAFSATLGEGVGLLFSPAGVIFTGVGILLAAAKDVRASQDTLVDIFERIEGYFRRLEIYTAVSPTAEMMDIVVKIMVEVLCILGIATKEIKQSRAKKYMKKLIGRTDLEDALKSLDELTQEEAQMATAEVLKATQCCRRPSDGVAGIDDKVASVNDTTISVKDMVAVVGERAAGIDDKVAGVGEKMRAVDDKVAVVINDGTTPLHEAAMHG